MSRFGIRRSGFQSITLLPSCQQKYRTLFWSVLKCKNQSNLSKEICTDRRLLPPYRNFWLKASSLTLLGPELNFSVRTDVFRRNGQASPSKLTTSVKIVRSYRQNWRIPSKWPSFTVEIDVFRQNCQVAPSKLTRQNWRPPSKLPHWNDPLSQRDANIWKILYITISPHSHT